MKKLIYLILLFSTPLYANELVTSLYNCTHKNNNLIRQVKIVHKERGCEVIYNKSVGTTNESSKILWNAKNSSEYCDNKGHNFVEEKLQREFGWVCIDEMNK